MGDILFLALRKLRAPLITLILAYAISVVGLVHMPGVDAQGQSAPLSFFHAFYVISYTATTIGFGELPWAFTDAQRAWVTFSIYLTVTCWAYTLGSVFALVQDGTFRGALARSTFAMRVKMLDEPFYVIAGYGQSGIALAHAFDDLGVRTVLIELRPDRAARPDVEIYSDPPLALAADARWPDVLQDAGVRHPRCKALIVLVGDDEIAQAVAIGAAVLKPDLPIIARVHNNLARANLDGFGNITVINPFETFAANLELSISAPAVLWIEEWLTSVPGGACPKTVEIPRGHWIVFSYSRFGHAVARALERTGSTWTAIDSNVELADELHLQHSDSSEGSLRAAGIDHAVGVIACTARDAINLALVTRARRLKPDVCVLIRQNHVADRSLIEAANAQVMFVKSEIMLRECLQVLTTPLLNQFLLQVRAGGNAVAEQIIIRLLTELDERVPHLWAFNCFESYPGLHGVLGEGSPAPLKLFELLINPLDREEALRAVPLLLMRNDTPTMLPPLNTVLRGGDRLLFAGRGGMEALQRRFLLDPSPLEYVRTGVEPARSWIFRRLTGRRERRI